MAGPGAREVARVSVRVLPDTSSFTPALERFLTRTEKRLRIELPTVIDTDRLVTQVQRAAAVAQRSTKVELAAALNGQHATAELLGLTRKLARTAPPVPVSATVPPTEWTRLREQLRERIQRLSLAQRAIQVRAELEQSTSGRLLLQVASMTRRLATAAVVRLRVDLDNGRMAAAAGALGKAVLSLTQLGAAGAGIGAVAGLLLGLAAAASSAAGAVALLPAGLAVAGAAFAALSLGLKGFGEAMSNLGDAEKFNEAIAKLAPSARSAALAVRELAPAYRSLQLDVQQTLFRGLAEQIRSLGTTYLPVLRTGLVDIAGALNTGARSVAAFAAEQRTVADLGTLFSNAQAAVFNLGGAIRPLLSAFRDIAVVASGFLPDLAAGAAAAAQKFGDFVAKARESGKLHEWISTALATLDTLKDILGNVIGSITAILRAGQQTGGGLLQIIAQLTGKIEEFLRSAEGQDMLRAVFETLANVAKALLPVLLEAAKIIGTVVVPAIGEFVTALLNGGGPKALLDALRESFAALQPALEPLGRALSNLLAALAPLLPKLAELAGAILTALADALASIDWTPVVDGLLECLDALDPLIVPLTRLITYLATAANERLPLLADALSIASGAIEFLTRFLGGLIDVVLDVEDGLRSLAGSVASAVGDAGAAVADWARGVWRRIEEVGQLFYDLPGKIKRALGDAARYLIDAGRDLIQGMINGVSDRARQLYDKVRDLAHRAVNAIKEALGISSPSKVFAQLGRFSAEGFADGLTAGIPLALKAATDLAEAATPVPPAWEPAQGGPGDAGAQPGAVTINVYPQAGQSEESIAAAVARRLAFQGRYV
ncbi:hypothetical protein M8C13_06285 [Crossiella sp. SN42]|uniref:phage tail protein n=1 Tax=Crossiella sp. SN42 TaxID=2944808 RepID=UPI00207C7F7A|nr:hypothetical protein [Crossiella sp. SN42]MCO1575368.1 hypothetical protein [Crossiella sp. SN42]